MQRFRNILYASTGLCPDVEGLRQALLLAQQHRAAVRCLVVFPEPPATHQAYREVFFRFLRWHAEQAIEEARLTLDPVPLADVVPVMVQVSGGALAVPLIRHVLREQNDLLIKEVDPAPQGRIAEIDLALLRKCPCPLWLARPCNRPWAELRIAAAVDPGNRERVKQDLAIRILRYADALAGMSGTGFDILSCWDFEFDQYVHSKTRIPADGPTIVNAQTAHGQELDRLIGASGIGGSFQLRRLKGRASEIIPLFANSQELDLLIIGAEGQSGVLGFLLGRTAETILGDLNCSLLVLKPGEYVSPVRF